MIHGSVGAMQHSMAHQKIHLHSGGPQPEIRRPDRAQPPDHGAQIHDHAGKPARMGPAGDGGFARPVHSHFDHATGNTLFADRMRMENRAEFRGQAMDIRHEIRDIMGSVENGELTTEQQGGLDTQVQALLDLRAEFNILPGHEASVSDLSTKILDHFGVEPAPVEPPVDPEPMPPVSDVPEPGEIPADDDVVVAPPDDTEIVEPPADDVVVAPVEEPVDDVSEETDVVVEEPAPDTDAPDSETVAALVDQLAGVIVDAESLIEQLVDAVG